MTRPRTPRSRWLWLLLPLIVCGLVLAGGGHALHGGDAHGDLAGHSGPDGDWSPEVADCALCGVHVAASGIEEPPAVVRRALGRANGLEPPAPPARVERGAQRGRAPPRADGSV